MAEAAEALRRWTKGCDLGRGVYANRRCIHGALRRFGSDGGSGAWERMILNETGGVRLTRLCDRTNVLNQAALLSQLLECRNGRHDLGEWWNCSRDHHGHYVIVAFQ